LFIAFYDAAVLLSCGKQNFEKANPERLTAAKKGYREEYGSTLNCIFIMLISAGNVTLAELKQPERRIWCGLQPPLT